MSSDAEEKKAFPEETKVYKILKTWEGKFTEGPITRNKNQIEVLINKSDLLTFGKFLIEKDWVYVTSLSGADYPEREGAQLELIYHWASYTSNKLIIVKTRTSYEDPVIPSLSSVTQSANFHEREVFDLFGIRFPGHDKADELGALPHLLLPDKWPQDEDDPPYPFRKDYVQKPRPFEKVTDTRGNQGKWQNYKRPIDRSGWLDEYYKEESPIETSNTKKVYLSESVENEPEEDSKSDE